MLNVWKEGIIAKKEKNYAGCLVGGERLAERGRRRFPTEDGGDVRECEKRRPLEMRLQRQSE